MCTARAHCVWYCFIWQVWDILTNTEYVQEGKLRGGFVSLEIMERIHVDQIEPA